MSENIRTIENHKIPSDDLYKGPKVHHFYDFAHHLSSIGLMASIIAQFTGRCYGTTDKGMITFKMAPKEKLGTTVVDKLDRAVFEWLKHLLSDVCGSSQATNGGAGITGPIMSHLKALSSLPPFSNKNEETEFVKLLKNAYTGSNKEKVQFDFRTELGIAKHIVKTSWTVLINEALVRAFYSIKRFILEYQQKKEGLSEEINWERVLPFNNRTIKRMLTISSGVFVAITTAGAAIKGAKQSGGNGYAFLIAFVLNLNFAGIGRFAIALALDSKYIKADVKEYCQAFKERYGIREPKPLVGIEKLCLNKRQVKLLYSLKRQKVLYDIEKSKDSVKEKKQEWLNLWEQKINAANTAFGKEYFIKEKESLYQAINTEITLSNGEEWLYLVALELLFFVPYFPIEGTYEKELKKLKLQSEYEKDIFCQNQSLVNEEQIKNSLEDYRRYVFIIDEKLKKQAIATTIASAVLLPGDITGLSLLMAAPILLTGYVATEQFQLIMGGGALFSIVGASVPNFSEKGIILNECARLLIYCKNAIPTQKDSLEKIKISVSRTVGKLEKELQTLESERAQSREKKEKIKSCKISLGYLNKCILEIEAIKTI